MGKGGGTYQTPGVAAPTDTEQQSLSYVDNWTNSLGRNLPIFMQSPEYNYGQDMTNWSTDTQGQLNARLSDSASKLNDGAYSGKLNPEWEKNMTDTVNRTVQNTMGSNLQDAASRGVVNSTYSSGLMDRLGRSTADSIVDNYSNLYKLQNDTISQSNDDLTKAISNMSDMPLASWNSALLPLMAQQQYMQPVIDLWQTMYQSRMQPGTENTVVDEGSGGLLDLVSAIAPAFKFTL